MAAAQLTVTHNIKVLMNNAVPRVSQDRIGEVINLQQPQVSKRMNGTKSWEINELEQIAQFFGVELKLLVEKDPNAIYRWLAENGQIDLRDRPIPPSSCDHAARPHELTLPFPADESLVVYLSDRRLAQTDEIESVALYPIAR